MKMSNKWTEEQQSAIDLRNCSILVSAAAGSGKTAVLVERILKKVIDKNNPVNIDQMVVVTFTKAAAGEMKDRIRAAIEKAAAANPEDTHLQKQKTLIHHANITTIDAFCSMIIKDHFDKIDMDPSSRIAENGEIKLLQSEALDEVIEEYYRKEAEGELKGQFTNLIEKISSGKDDLELEKIIMKIFGFSMSYAFPEKWLDSLVSGYTCESLEQLENMYWMESLREDLDNLINHIRDYVNSAMQLIDLPDGPYMYAPTFHDYADLVSNLEKCERYSDAYEILKSFSPKSLSTKKDAAVNKDLREEAKNMRDECKKAVEIIKDKYYFQPASKMQEDLNLMRDNIYILSDIVKSFIECFSAKKREKNVHDFSDLEHMALKILVDEDGRATEAAREYGEYFDEIMIDEYQDSNYVQETLLSSISKRYKGQENVFMVGDAKQSIYKFRLARPEIFTEKYDNYSVMSYENKEIQNKTARDVGLDKLDTTKNAENAQQVRIDLFKNFRSRSEVLHSVNYIFERIMNKSLGGIDYNNNAALHPGASYPRPEKTGANNTELLMFENSSLEDMTSQEFEAELIALRIKQLVSESEPYMVTDKETGRFRPCTYRDIAILVRNNTTLANACMTIFEKENIPLVVPAAKGYFESEEIDIVLNFLKIIDNPMQDIPLASILKSPIVSLSEDELSIIRIEDRNSCFYEAVCNYAANHSDEKDNILSVKLTKFIKQLDLFRKKVNLLPLHEFLWLILDETGYGDYICAMPNGEQKNANMQMLISKAIDFESTSYIGVFQFVKYIEQVKSYDDKEGQASLINENENAVRLMTIHKSKGLEFPIVFVIGLGGSFNLQDEKSLIILHPDLGIGINAINLDTRHMKKTLLKNVINRRIHMESIAEEMRVLYVAMTRAKEKLILSGGVKNIQSSLMKARLSNNCEKISPITLSQHACYLDWILAALKYHPDMKPIYKNYFDSAPSYFTVNNWECNFDISITDTNRFIEEKLVNEIIEEEKSFEFDECLEETGKTGNRLNTILNFKYQHGVKDSIPIKISVSDIKKAFMEPDEFDESVNNIYTDIDSDLSDIFSDTHTDENFEPDNTVDIIYPDFMKNQNEEIVGTDRGTLYHSIFEFLDYNRLGSYDDIETQINEMFEKGLLDSKMKPYVKAKSFEKFAASNLGHRMKKAALNGNLWREQPFVLGVSAKVINENASDDEIVLVQGIIDAFFIEDNELVLVDYKTDRVGRDSEEFLARRYRKQMEYYKDALTRLFEKKVKECIIYSVSLNKEIIVS